MGNFDFLEKVNGEAAQIASIAEKLFRDEYFEQCIVQTRKMAEILTKSILGSKAVSDDTFDDMLYKLKTISKNTFQEQEFISDMYFLKKYGNRAAHESANSDNGKIALECLEHAFEAAVNYAYAITHDEKINQLIFDEKLLVLGEKNTTLQENYKKTLQKEQQENKNIENQIKQTSQMEKTTSTPNKKTKKDSIPVTQEKKQTSFFTKVVCFALVLGFIVIDGLYFLLHSKNISFEKSKETKQEIKQDSKKDFSQKKERTSDKSAKKSVRKFSSTFSSLK